MVNAPAGELRSPKVVEPAPVSAAHTPEKLSKRERRMAIIYFVPQVL